MKTLTLILISLAFWNCSFAQSYDNNWVFGDSAGLTFSTGEPAFFETHITCYEAAASISDEDGNLLFYTNGQNVWNRENETMPNGSGLQIGGLGPDTLSGSSFTQGVSIIKKPMSSNIYYVFYKQNSGFLYCIVDMSLDGELGDVLEKNVVLSDLNFTEKMMSVRHANGRDWWLILHAFPDIDAGDSAYFFVKYLITPSGISALNYQTYGPLYNFDDGTTAWGQMKFNQKGDMLAYCRGKHVDLYDFDRCTGEFSDFFTITNVDSKNTYGCEFSEDGTKLYVSNLGDGDDGFLYQYCLSCALDIPDTKSIIYQNTYNHYKFGQMQIGRDNKIYFVTAYNTVPTDVVSPQNTNLSVINKPNLEGLLCDVDTLTVSLGERRVIFGLPNMPNYNLGALIGSGCDTLTAINAESKNAGIDIYPNPATSFINISSQLADHCSVTACIYSITGTRLKEIVITSPLQKIDIDLPQGVYTVVIKNENEYIYSDKFVVTQ